MHQEGHFTLLGPFLKSGDQMGHGALVSKGLVDVLGISK